ncbi:Uncharacterised protein [Salmonella enterica subsp. indica]|uniref:Uncharacterized protein n=1 Tax=Salmonella enterica subsp. indica TaxID=59207 RepID=A0A379XTQ6_SALER|nr:Uncharacterised protein [Salmonella enterica subsp. indica]
MGHLNDNGKVQDNDWLDYLNALDNIRCVKCSKYHVASISTKIILQGRRRDFLLLLMQL